MPAKGSYKNPVCPACGEKKPTSLTVKTQCPACKRLITKLRGNRRYYRKNKVVLREANRAYWEKTREQQNERLRRRYKADPEKEKAAAKLRYQKNRKRRIAQSKARATLLQAVAPQILAGYQRNTRRRNPAKYTATLAASRAKQLNATPWWIDRGAIEDVYALAELMSRLLGEPYEVDHIVPLRSKKVCGMHVPWNLRVISRKENSAKSNKHWPGMPK